MRNYEHENEYHRSPYNVACKKKELLHHNQFSCFASLE